MPIQFEHPVNWRLARLGFRSPATPVSFDRPVQAAAGDLMLFLPQDHAIDVIALRDWLHNHDNNSGGYQMIGCYEDKGADRINFVGLKFAFAKAIDAIIFQLFWTSAIVLRSKYLIK